MIPFPYQTGQFGRRAAGAGDKDPFFANVELLLHMEGANGSTTFTDSSSRASTFAALGNAQISTARSKFGSASGLFDGTGDRITTPDRTGLRLGTSDFTIEAFVYPDSAGINTNRGIYTKRASNAVFREVTIYITSGNRFEFLGTFNGTTWGLVITDAATITHNQWYHIAMTRSGSSFFAFVNGTQVGTGTNAGALTAAADDCVVGALGANGDFSFYGNIDEFRFTKGTARYTSAFTPPTMQFPDS